MSQSAQNDLPAFFTYLFIFKPLEIAGSLQQSLELLGKCWKVLKMIFRQFLKIFGSVQKTFLSISEVYRKLFYNIPTLTPVD